VRVRVRVRVSVRVRVRVRVMMLTCYRDDAHPGRELALRIQFE